INAGNNAGVPTADQRGFARISNGTVDIGAFEAQPVTFTVTNTNDSGPGSLRQYVQDNNLLGGGNTITFAIPTTDPGFHPATGQFTIPLTGGELNVTNDLTVQGPGANLLTVSGNSTSRVFDLSPGGTHNFTFSGLTIANGKINFGGGMQFAFTSGTLTIQDCV